MIIYGDTYPDSTVAGMWVRNTDAILCRVIMHN